MKLINQVILIKFNKYFYQKSRNEEWLLTNFQKLWKTKWFLENFSLEHEFLNRKIKQLRVILTTFTESIFAPNFSVKIFTEKNYRMITKSAVIITKFHIN